MFLEDEEISHTAAAETAGAADTGNQAEAGKEPEEEGRKRRRKRTGEENKKKRGKGEGEDEPAPPTIIVTAPSDQVTSPCFVVFSKMCLKQCCGSGMFYPGSDHCSIPDPDPTIAPSRIRNVPVPVIGK
jgi:hypothetical protein